MAEMLDLYGRSGYRTSWRWNAVALGWWLAVALSLGLWALLIYAALSILW